LRMVSDEVSEVYGMRNRSENERVCGSASPIVRAQNVGPLCQQLRQGVEVW